MFRRIAAIVLIAACTLTLFSEADLLRASHKVQSLAFFSQITTWTKAVVLMTQNETCDGRLNTVDKSPVEESQVSTGASANAPLQWWSCDQIVAAHSPATETVVWEWAHDLALAHLGDTPPTPPPRG